MAEAARNNGIAMEMTDRRDMATAPSFTKTQVKPSYEDGRTRHAGTSEAAQVRYDAKRAEVPSQAHTELSRAYTQAARAHWKMVASISGDQSITKFAGEVGQRFVAAEVSGQPQESARQGESIIAAAGFAAVVKHDRSEGGSKPQTINDEMLRAHEVQGLNTGETSMTTNTDAKMRDDRFATKEQLDTYEARARSELNRAYEKVQPEDRASLDKTVKAFDRMIDARRSLLSIQEIAQLQNSGIEASIAKEAREQGAEIKRPSSVKGGREVDLEEQSQETVALKGSPHEKAILEDPHVGSKVRNGHANELRPVKSVRSQRDRGDFEAG